MSTMGFVPYSGNFPVIALPENGSTFVAGDLCYFASGYVGVATSYATIGFVALQAATGVSGTLLPFIPILPEQRWLAQASATTTLTNQGIYGPLTYTSGSMSVTPETSDTSNKEFMIEQLDPRDGAYTGAGGRVIGRFNTTVEREVYRS